MPHITPAIVGPGIEEEYDDLLLRIAKLETLLKTFPASNDTREGRMVYLLAWLKQEIGGKRLPIPLDRKYWGTLARLIAEGSLDYLGGENEMGDIATILDGEGLLKPRHWPVVGEILDEFLDFVYAHLSAPSAVNSIEQQFLDEAKKIRKIIAAGAALPLREKEYPGWLGMYGGANYLKTLPNFGNRRYALVRSIFYGIRPASCRKGPLKAPNPGMIWGTDS